ncbi:hypothetical protein [Ancylobacter dichloromethanicus]|uniref:hypothetical protein n=1 Tax=Ancylobacter dichloromethanicus TaxID=518825 RepID=UPI00361196A1
MPVVEPGTTGVCLWQKSCSALDLDPARCDAMPGYEGKVRFEPRREHQLSPSRLRAFIVLEREDGVAAPALRPLSRAEILVAAIRQLVLFNPAAPPLEERASGIGRLNDMIRVVPGYALRVPSSFPALAGIPPLLERLLIA